MVEFTLSPPERTCGKGKQVKYPHILIYEEAYKKLNELSQKTGFSMAHIASYGILYALENMEKEEDQDNGNQET